MKRLITNLQKIMSVVVLRLRDFGIEILFKYSDEKERFTLIYRKKYWARNEFDPVSGQGSTLPATAKIRYELPRLLEYFKIRSMVDIPCGDFNWMSTVDLHGVDYIGADIVEDLIEKNNEKFFQENRTFKVLDLLKDQLPTTDLVFCRDCFVHMTEQQIIVALRNIISSKSRYLLTTSWENLLTNEGSNRPDRWRPLNLSLPPYSLGLPLLTIDDSNAASKVDFGKSMFLFDISVMSTKLR